MKKQDLLQLIHDRLYTVHGECICPLNHGSPFQLLAAVMLSAQCRDERVNQVTSQLFTIAPDPQKMADMPIDEIEKIIHPCGLSGSKSRNLHAAAKMLISDFNGIVPQKMEELITLPGIGRKSANVILGNCFNIPGFPVDTHVKRVLNRIGAVSSNDPEKIEALVNRLVPSGLWTNFSHLIIQHGRLACHARSPECPTCPLADICAKKGINK